MASATKYSLEVLCILELVERKTPKISGCQAERLLRGSARCSSHFRQKTTPRNVQMMQMNVPQLSQGYPSDARSSLLQERQIIASRSRRIWRIVAIVRTDWR